MNKKKTLWSVWGSATAVVVIGALVWGIFNDIRLAKYENDIKMAYQRNFTEVVQYVDDLQLSLEKSRFVNDSGQMMKLSGDIYRQASSAEANLAMLPLRGEPLENLTEFLNQAGDYAYALSFKVLNGEAVTNEEYDNLVKLGDYAKVVAESLDANMEQLYSGAISMERSAAGTINAAGIDAAMGEIETQLHDYPSLIYDGPFSSHLTDRESLFLKDKAEVDEASALDTAEKAFGNRDFLVEEEGGNIPAYYLSNKDREESVMITKQGGYLLSYLNDREIGEPNFDIVDAKIAAATFLEKMGFGEMKENYYETISNVAVINYAPTKEGYTLYPDLVKVKIALDDCSVVGFEGRGYIMYHREREIPRVKISEEEARGKINARVEIISSTLSVIPADDGGEDFCWQIEGRINDRRCLVYINTQTGTEENLFLLIESDTGVLAV